MKHCYQQPYHVTCVSCLYPPIINKRFKEADFHLKILNIVSVHLGFQSYDIIGLSRKREIVDARHLAMILIIKYLPKLTLNEIGKGFKRDHATVISAKKKCKSLINTNKEFKLKYTELVKKIDSYIERTTIN